MIIANLRRVFGASVPAKEIDRLARAHYAHLWQLIVEFFRFRWLSAERKRALVRVENLDSFIRAFESGHGVLVLTGHFGNWEVATVAGILSYPEVHGRFHFVRRPIKPRWLDAWVTRRFNRAGFGVIGKRGSLERIVSLLEQGDVIVFPFDQYAGGRDGIDVEFFGTPAGTFRSLACDRARDRSAGATRRVLARARRDPRAALRGTGRSPPTRLMPTRRFAGRRAAIMQRWRE